jgi:hypothetical protein
MSASGRDCLGLDLTQHRPVRVRLGADGIAHGGYGEGLLPPSAVLPAVRGEPLVVGKAADEHRQAA